MKQSDQSLAFVVVTCRTDVIDQVAVREREREREFKLRVSQL